MKKTKVKIPAKINLTLDIVGKENGYHNLKSIVCPIAVYDVIFAKKRKDKDIRLKIKGFPVDCEIKSSNAFIACEAFVKAFDSYGADITIKRNIYKGAGLGGSSADIVGVLRAMANLYGKKDEDILPLASRLGSDCACMLKGKICVMEGRGEKVSELNYDKKLYLIMGIADGGISTKECFSLFDKENKIYPESTEKVIKLINKRKDFSGELKNDLFIPATKLNGNVLSLYEKLKEYNAVMSGSGSAVYSVFYKKKDRNKAYKKLKDKTLIKTYTI